MNSSLRHLNSLRAFEAAARHCSFAKAAQELNVSHSVVSQHIKNLELWFGTKLFVRYGNRIELSDDGRMLMPQVANGFQILRDACESLLHQNQTGTVTVCAEPAIASRWLRRKITEFCGEYPRIEVDLKPVWTPLVTGDPSSSIVIHFEERIPANSTSQQRWFPIDGFPACSPELYKKIVYADAVALFYDLPLLHDSGRQTWQQWFSKYLPERREWEKGKVYSDLSLAIDAAVDGEGIILADNIICRKEIESGSLVRLDNRAIRCTWYSVATDNNKMQHPPVATFQSWLMEQFANIDFGAS
ncbi:LysR family transcriptional regulator [Oceanisphaera psychrotolerans]|uniref:HTH lysR-type domain-containing protein n=1 Tax=Oceanisphaera psychrotolerans TaxID=1414654 RepID=A0A1J4QDZ6_9GAMM|nr:LysR family transcriptional regulator [Oceanisphaera psychrotolerans]OIN06588.1 hypothetical protein BFR47_04330 [Oceanisphaera psychrotolerans]